MKRIFILICLCFLCAGAVYAQTEDPHHRKGTSSTGMIRTGCDTAKFVEWQGRHNFLPRLERTGRKLNFGLLVVDTILGCGITEEEALLRITIEWDRESDYMPKIIERGVIYYPKSDTTATDTVPDPYLDPSDCGDGEFEILIYPLIPGTDYVTFAYAITIAHDTIRSPKMFITKPRTTCPGWLHRSNENYDHDRTDPGIDRVFDVDSNYYGVIQIGRQCWTKENMRCITSPTKRLVMADVYKVVNGIDYYDTSSIDPYFYHFDALNISLRQRGLLYNWPAVVDTFGVVKDLPSGKRQGICPDGWHVPNTYEWYELICEVIDDPRSLRDYHTKTHNDNTGFKRFWGKNVVNLSFGCQWPTSYTDTNDIVHKYADTHPGGYMSTPDKRNSSGFTALPTSNVHETGYLGGFDKAVSNFWLADPAPDPWPYKKPNGEDDRLFNNTWKPLDNAYSWHIDEDKPGVSSYCDERLRKRGFSVRCLRDQLIIAANPNSCKFCVPREETYTASVANEDLNNFTFTWKVYKDGSPDPIHLDSIIDGSSIQYVDSVKKNKNDEDFTSFTFTHVDTLKYKIICRAERDTIKKTVMGTDSLPAMVLLDSVFMTGTGFCSLISVDPPTLACCVNGSKTFTASKKGVTFSSIHWYVNGTEKSDSNPFNYTFPKDTTYTIKFTATDQNDTSYKDSLTITVSKHPTMTICSSCEGNAFVIKKTTELGSIGSLKSEVEWYYQDSVVSYHKEINSRVHAELGKTYDVTMVTAAGCYDTTTLKGLQLVVPPPYQGCSGLKAHNEAGNTVEERIDSVYDHEGNRYAVVQIGNRCWMKENMRATTSPSGNRERIVNPVGKQGNAATQSLTSQAAHWYLNDSTTYHKYGLLYNWCAATDTFRPGGSYPKVATGDAGGELDKWSCTFSDLVPRRGICPDGWHLPTNDEWTAMEIAANDNIVPPINGNYRVSHADKLSGGCDWTYSDTPNSPGDYNNNNRRCTSFAALPAGYTGAAFEGSITQKARFWSSTQDVNKEEDAYQRGLEYNTTKVEFIGYNKRRCMSVRCIRDIPTMVLRLTEKDCHRGKVIAVFHPDESEDFEYKWTVNGTDSTGDANKLNLSFNDEIGSYHVVCKALFNTEVIFADSIDIKLPSMTVLVDSFAGAFKIKDPQNLTKVYWKKKQSDDSYQIISTKTSGYIDSLQNGTYLVEIYNADNSSCKTIDNIVLKIVHTTCTVTSYDPSRDSVRINPDNNTEYLLDSIKDASGNWYRVVEYTVNNKKQCWLRENLRTTKDSTGYNDLVPGNPNSVSKTDITSYYYNYPTTDKIPIRQRGYLYNWNAAKEACPKGWHLPSNQEWKDLWNALKFTYMDNKNKSCMLAGGYSWTESTVANAAGNMSAPGRNKTGLSIIPAGNLGEPNGSGKASFGWALTDANLWTSTPNADVEGNSYIIVVKNSNSHMGNTSNNFDLWKTTYRAFSVRCVRDPDPDPSTD
ncbi:MAG: hypothetical protein J6X01_00535 [Bacteroidales bacterium]|nr:hypothetical protein [Bacteroidales bacterium]